MPSASSLLANPHTAGLSAVPTLLLPWWPRAGLWEKPALPLFLFLAGVKSYFMSYMGRRLPESIQAVPRFSFLHPRILLWLPRRCTCHLPAPSTAGPAGPAEQREDGAASLEVVEPSSSLAERRAFLPGPALQICLRKAEQNNAQDGAERAGWREQSSASHGEE